MSCHPPDLIESAIKSKQVHRLCCDVVTQDES